MEFKVLEAQINPHFIYNTLDAIKWAALMNNASPVANAISSFVKLLRISLAEGKEALTVEKEVEHAQHYIELMVFRNNYNVEVVYDISPEVRSMYSLKLILQPFIENCFLHAFEKNQLHAQIIIKGYVGDGKLIIEIIDNGKGFSIKEDDLTSELFSGIGIYNTDKRLKLWHGDTFGSLFIFYVIMNMPFCVITMRSFFERIPITLEEAARVDGCSKMQGLIKIIIPIMFPGIVAVFVFAFIGAWNELIAGVIFINTPDKWTIPVGLNSPFNTV